MTCEKLEVDGKVAVLYSPNFGAGWYTWNQWCKEIIFDKELVEIVLKGDFEKVVGIAERKYPGIYTGGGSNLKVEWVPKGERFVITEYDGSEDVIVIGPDYGIVA